MKKIILTALLLLVLGVTACSSEPTIDGSSEAAFKVSVEKMIQDMDEQKKDAFDNAMTIVAFSKVDFKAIMADVKNGKEPNIDSVYEELDGMTADDIIERGKEITAARKAKK